MTETPSATLSRLRTTAAALTPGAADLALRLLPAAGRMPDAWHAALVSDLLCRSDTAAPLVPVVAFAVDACAELRMDAWPAWLIEEPDGASASSLLVDVWLSAEMQRVVSMQPRTGAAP